MPSGELLKQLFRKYKVGDDGGFESVANRIIAEEREKNHHVLASELQKILLNGTTPGHNINPLKQLPKDQGDDLPLVDVRYTEKLWADLIVSEKNQIQLERILLELQRQEVLRMHGVRPNTRLLFCGPPGCGKTLTAEVLAGELGLPLLYTRFDSIISSYLGQTSSNLRKVFDFASSGPWVVFFDEFDAIGKSRDDQGEHGELKRVVNTFLQLLDSFTGDSILIAATNHEGLLDNALWRRFDSILYFDLPTPPQIPDIVCRKLRSFRHSKLELTENMINHMIGLSHADIERICFAAIKEAVLKQQDQITNLEFEQALTYQLDRQMIIQRNKY